MKILRLINHPNIVKCYEILEDEASIYIIMDLCEDGDLESRIDQYGAVVEADALPIVKGVFKGLLYLTEMNIIHRDIKVANIFMSKNIPKIADFGFAFHNKTKYFILYDP
jgi:serine/threonine protein kinase